jgi:hypothetical protein
VLFLLIVIAGAAVVAAPLLPLPPLKAAAENRLSKILGRNVTVNTARLSVLDGGSLRLAGVSALEDPAFGDGTFLKAEDVRAGIDAGRYLRSRRLVIDSLRLTSVEISLVRNIDGTWNWTTLGAKGSQAVSSSEPTSTDPVVMAAGLTESILSLISLPGSGDPAADGLREISIENCSVRLIDRAGSKASEALYRNITLNASLERISSGEAGPATRAKGELDIQPSGDGSESETLRASLPFDLLISHSTSLNVSGSIGPGPLETKSLKVGGLSVKGKLRAERGKPLAAEGQLTGADMFIDTMNLSDQVSRAVHVNQIGDTNPGTGIATLEAAFQIDQGTVNTTNLRVHQLDGLGDARADSGSFKVDSSLTVNYSATVTLSPEATARVKSAGPMLGFLATLLESNNQLSVPVTISGDLRQPDVRVDVNRIF